METVSPNPADLAAPRAPTATVTQIAAAGQILYALGNDGSLWRLMNPNDPDYSYARELWVQILPKAPYP